jgi:hypothetical protein
LKKKKKLQIFPLVFIGSYERVLPDLERGKTQTPEKSIVKKTKLRATLYHNHKRRTEEEVVRLFIAAIRIEVDAIPVNVGIYVQPFEENISKGEKKFSLP